VNTNLRPTARDDEAAFISALDRIYKQYDQEGLAIVRQILDHVGAGDCVAAAQLAARLHDMAPTEFQARLVLAGGEQ